MAFESVRPHTLVLKRLSISGLPDVYKVYGGKNEDIWCATFVCSDEAQAWIDGGKHFGQPVKGYKHDAPGKDSGTVPEAAGGAAEGSVREVQERDAGGSGSTLLVP